MSLQANQKLSKAVLLKDLYLELERMKEGLHIEDNIMSIFSCFSYANYQMSYLIINCCMINADVRAARDKNGVYIAHERYTQEEAEKKVSSKDRT